MYQPSLTVCAKFFIPITKLSVLCNWLELKPICVFLLFQVRIYFYLIFVCLHVRCIGRGVHRVRSHPLPPQLKRSTLKGHVRLKNVNLCKKHQRWTIIFWFVTVPNVFFSDVDDLELCSCYWFICRNPIAIAFCNPRNYERTGLVHPSSPIRQCSNECFGQSVIKNLVNTVVFAQYMWLFHPNCNAVRKSTISISTRFAPANDCVLFALVKLALIICCVAFWEHSGVRFQSYFHF